MNQLNFRLIKQVTKGICISDELDRRVESTESFSDEGRALREKRAELHMNAHLQPLIDAGYVKWEELDDGMATKEFIAMVLYRMFKEVRPYHGGIDLKDSEDTAVRWAVEVGLPGFIVDQKGYIYPQLPLNLEAGPEKYAQEQPYLRIFQFINLIHHPRFAKEKFAVIKSVLENVK